MKEFNGKLVKLEIEVRTKEDHVKHLFYTARIISVSETHVSFIDKFGDTFTYLITSIIQIREIVRGTNEN